MQSCSQLVNTKLTIYWQSLCESIMLHGQHLGHTLGSWPLDAGIAAEVQDGPGMCLATMGSTLGTNFLLQAFLSYLQGELKHWAHMSKDTEMLDVK